MKRHIFAAAFGALLVVLPIPDALRADATLYTVEDLGSIGGFVPTVTGMNATGQVSGFYTASGLRHAVRFTDGVGWEPVPGVSTLYSMATGINDHGDVVGYDWSGSAFRAFRFIDGVGVSYIAPLPGGTTTYGLGINANGDIVGQGDSPVGTRGFRAFLGLPAVALPTLGGTSAIACGINAAGQIAGKSTTSGGYEHPYRLEADDSITDIVPFAGAAGSGAACAIDAAGRVGGKAQSGSAFRAFTFDSGAPVNVDTFASQQSNVESVSEGVSVGWFISLADGTAHAFVHTPDGSVDLNDVITPGSGWKLSQAFAVNASGSVAGNGSLSGAPKAFRLTRVASAPADTTPPVITSVTASPSTIWPPNDALVPVTLSVTATDDVDAAPACTLTTITSTGTTADDFSITGPLSAQVRAVGGQTYTLTVQCSDTAGNSSNASVAVVVPPDTTAPAITSIHATPSAIWPPNGKWVPVEVSVTATDDVDASPSCALSSITGAASTEFMITGAFTASVRADKDSEGTTRVYALHVSCGDRAGNVSSAAAYVSVSKDPLQPETAAARQKK